MSRRHTCRRRRCYTVIRYEPRAGPISSTVAVAPPQSSPLLGRRRRRSDGGGSGGVIESVAEATVGYFERLDGRRRRAHTVISGRLQRASSSWLSSSASACGSCDSRAFGRNDGRRRRRLVVGRRPTVIVDCGRQLEHRRWSIGRLDDDNDDDDCRRQATTTSDDDDVARSHGCRWWPLVVGCLGRLSCCTCFLTASSLPFAALS